MPGHNHSLVPKLKPGDLGTQEAFFLWNCPIKDEGLQSDNTLSSKYNFLYLRGGNRQHSSELFSYIRSILTDNFSFSFDRVFQEHENLTSTMEHNRNYLSDSFGDFLFNNDEYLWTPVRTYYKKKLL